MSLPKTIHQALTAQENGERTAKELVCAYFQQILDHDTGPQGCNAVGIVNPDALFIAQGIDAQRQAGVAQGPLAGIPILIKANIDTGDKMPTTGGTTYLQDHYATQDAFVVEKLRRAGAVLLGKTNMSELANFMSYTMPAGYSAWGAQVRNFHNKTGPVGGSSSGAGVAMAANLAVACVGTETNASILWPAQCSGVVGLKPSMGLVSRRGIMPICTALDVPGPITKTVRDAAIILDVMAGYDPQDPATHVMAHRPDEAFTRFLDTTELKGLRIGLYESKTLCSSPAQAAATQTLVDRLAQEGVVFTQIHDLAESPHVAPVELMEFRCCFNAYLSASNAKEKTLAQLLAYNQDHPAENLVHGQDRIADAQDCTGRMVEGAYLEGLLAREAVTAQLKTWFEETGLDAMLCTGGFTNLAPFTGFPSITVPIGRQDDNLPIGCCLVGNRFEDAKLLGVAQAIETLVQFQS